MSINANWLGNEIKHRPLLPFLYSTRTLLVAARTQISGQNSPLSGRRRRLISQRSSPPDPSEEVGQRPYKRTEFSGIQRYSGTQSRTGSQKSTITAGERAVFNRIFGDLTSQIFEGDENLFKDDLAKEYLDGDDESLTPQARLSNIFEAAISHSNEDARQKAEGEALAKAEAQAAVGTNREVVEDVPRRRMWILDTLNVRELPSFGQRHYRKTVKLLDQTKSDLELWQILEKQVFSVIPHLERQRKREEQARERQLQGKGRGRSAEEDSVDALGLRSAQDTKNNDEQNAPVLPVLKENESSTQKEAATIDDRRSFNTEELAVIAQHLYEYYCVVALRLFRHRYPFSPFALHLLPHVKSLGPISFALAASTNLYNEIIYQHFIQHNDYRGVADILQQMENQGLEPNYVTMQALWYVCRQYREAAAGDKGEVSKWWSTLRHIREPYASITEALRVMYVDKGIRKPGPAFVKFYPRERERDQDQDQGRDRGTAFRKLYSEQQEVGQAATLAT